MKDSKDGGSTAEDIHSTSTAEVDEFAPAIERKVENPLLKKIQNTIAQTDPKKWERYGDDLNQSTKYQKPREAWEIVCCITIPAGILAFRSSQPVASEYFGGGYTLTPLANERYTVELRPRAWNPRTLVDPYFRNVLEKDKEFQLLADGDVARTVFLQIEETLRSYMGEKNKEARQLLDELMKNIVAKVDESEAKTWKKSQPDLETIQFEGSIDATTVTVAYAKKDGIDQYRLLFAKDRTSIKSNDVALAKKLYEMVTNKLEQASLEALSQVLDGADI